MRTRRSFKGMPFALDDAATREMRVTIHDVDARIHSTRTRLAFEGTPFPFIDAPDHRTPARNRR